MTGLPIAGPATPLWAANPLLDTDFLIATGLLVFVLMVGAIIFGIVERWRRKQFEAPVEDSVESLTSFRAMYENGEITRSEYERIRGKVAVRVKGEVAAANPAAGRNPMESPIDQTDSRGSATSADGEDFSTKSGSATDSEPPSPTS